MAKNCTLDRYLLRYGDGRTTPLQEDEPLPAACACEVRGLEPGVTYSFELVARAGELSEAAEGVSCVMPEAPPKPIVRPDDWDDAESFDGLRKLEEQLARAVASLGRGDMRGALALLTPLVLAGDFNAGPDSSVYELLSTQGVQRGHPDLVPRVAAGYGGAPVQACRGVGFFRRAARVDDGCCPRRAPGRRRRASR